MSVHRLFIKVALLLCTLSIPTVQAVQNNTIVWLRLDFPPFEINAGPFKNQGIVDVIKQSVQRGLPDYQHVDGGLVNNDRLIASMKNTNVCHAAMLKTPEYEPISYLSVAIGMMPSHVIFTTPGVYQDKFNSVSMVSLSALLKDPKFMLGLPSRSMGATIDGIVKAHQGQSNIFNRYTASANGLIRMLLGSRFDYLIGYPAEVTLWNKTNPDQPLVAIRLSETDGQYTFGRVGCSRNDWGKKIVEKVNQYLDKHRLTESFIKEGYLPWIPNNLQANYVKDYHSIVAKENWSNAR